MNKKIIGINFGHNATVALIKDGEILSCVSEERFNKIKNSTGFPFMALNYVLKKYGSDISKYVLSQQHPWGYRGMKKNNFKSISVGKCIPKLSAKEKFIPEYYYHTMKKKMLNSIKEIEKNKKLKKEMEEYFEKILKTSKEKIIYLDHHTAHAFSTPFFQKNPQDEILVFTLDGEGDALCGSVRIIKNGKEKILSEINKAYSIGYLYSAITTFLGMKANEHEFKVMGLAPYSQKKYYEEIIPIFKEILWLNDKNEFESKIPTPIIDNYLADKLLYHRFDNISGAIQTYTENIVVEWITNWIKKTNIKNIGLAGGVFMNVKMNQKISDLDLVEKITITPSGGDESTAIGACFYGSIIDGHQIKHIKDIYLGTEYSDEQIFDVIKNLSKNKYEISKKTDIELAVAELLANNEVVARFSGKMEFGARALGNRSILSNPSTFENVRIINAMIKNRDFWMPFASSIIEEDKDKYIVDNKKTDAPYMIITFDTKKPAHDELQGSIHPYDKSVRPQIVTKKDNPKYHKLINYFREKTGIGAVLNTSFNLHGEPNVESPVDAVRTLENSGLKHLAIGSFLVSKKIK